MQGCSQLNDERLSPMMLEEVDEGLLINDLERQATKKVLSLWSDQPCWSILASNFSVKILFFVSKRLNEHY